jgi:hypothetical protein
MTLPFTLTKVYTTALTHDQLLVLLSGLQPSKKQWQLYDVDNYVLALVHKGFVLRHADPQHNLPAMPKIGGKLMQEYPTTIRLTIAPNYFLVAFLLLFPVVFVPAALFSDDWTINGVHRAPVLMERLSILLTGGGLPLLMGYVGAIIPVKKAEDWLVKKLALQEPSLGKAKTTQIPSEGL